ncbi:MAG: ribonuclease HII [Rhodospirillales bacterium]|nr:ribonuclease HII [Rhodospirillales bacterium]
MAGPDFTLEDAARGRGFGLIAGIDEAGRGPWAGPVVAAAVILTSNDMDTRLLDGLDDSKKLSAARREDLYDVIQATTITGIGRAEVDEIDDINILQASLLAMRRAVEALSQTPDYALIDGIFAPGLVCAEETVVKGDGRSFSIAAASILAKVSRDRIMVELAELHPGYGWERNKGYGTKDHRQGLELLGCTDHHRKSYKPIINILGL